MPLPRRDFLKGTLACLALVLTAPVPATETYRGFAIDDSAVRKLPDLDALIEATKEQIDIVHAVGLPVDILLFAQEAKLELVPDDTSKIPPLGRYFGRPGARSVQLSWGIVTARLKQPVLLHELMHAYHDQRLPQGFKNPLILYHYQRAQTLRAYWDKSHIMKNEMEFFACAATTYLFGVSSQEPRQRATIQDAQPYLYLFLQDLFGPHAGKYAGSLRR